MGGNEKIKSGNILNKMPTAVYLIFTLCMIFAVMYAARVYQNITEKYQTGSDIRTASLFSTMKARQSDISGNIKCENGRFISCEIFDDGSGASDILYFYNGWLMELYSLDDAAIYNNLEDAGDKILACDGAEFYDSENGIDYDIKLHDQYVSGHVYLRTGGVYEK